MWKNVPNAAMEQKDQKDVIIWDVPNVKKSGVGFVETTITLIAAKGFTHKKNSAKIYVNVY
jgi:hypothetical protein